MLYFREESQITLGKKGLFDFLNSFVNEDFVFVLFLLVYFDDYFFWTPHSIV